MLLTSLLCSCQNAEDKREAPPTATTEQPNASNSQAVAQPMPYSLEIPAEQRIAILEDSLALYRAIVAGDSHLLATAYQAPQPIRTQARHRRVHHDEAQGSLKRAGDAIKGGIDTIGTKVTHLFSAK